VTPAPIDIAWDALSILPGTDDRIRKPARDHSEVLLELHETLTPTIERSSRP
jgi:hypothetical protein